MPTVFSSACIGMAKEEKYFKVKHARHTEVGQDKELYPKLPSHGKVLHSTTFYTVTNTQNHGREQGKKLVLSAKRDR